MLKADSKTVYLGHPLMDTILYIYVCVGGGVKTIWDLTVQAARNSLLRNRKRGSANCGEAPFLCFF